MYGTAADGTVMQLGFPTLEYSIHRTWLLIADIAGSSFSLEGDEDFVLSFWNWDTGPRSQTFLPNVVPHFSRDPEAYPELMRAVRDPRHAPGNPDHLVDLTFSHLTHILPADHYDLIRTANNQLLYEYVVETAARSASGASGAGGEEDDDPQAKFLSARFHAGDSTRDIITDNPRSGNTFEIQIHSVVHAWLCDHDRGRQDMVGGRDFDDPDFLDAAFFYNENPQLVRVTVPDALDHRTLGYDWQQVHNPWMSAPPQSAAAAPEA